MAGDSLLPRLRFSGFELDAAAFRLQRNGEEVRLERRAMELLILLARRRDRLVSREEIIPALWPSNVVVDFDTGLNTLVRKLRHALGDSAQAPRFIETVPGKGYRFVAPVDERPPARAAVRTFAWPVLGAGIAAALLLVLAFDPGTAPGEPVAISADTNEHLARARFFLQRRSPGDANLAVEHFRQVIELDPGFAPAWAGLASAYWIETVSGTLDRELGLTKVRDSARRALELDPRAAEAHLRLANYHWSRDEFAIGDEHLRTAAALEPDNATYLGISASAAMRENRIAEAIALQRRAVAADPLSAIHRFNLGSLLYLSSQPAQAIDEVTAALQLNPELDPELIGHSFVLARRYDDALAAVRDWPDGPSRAQGLALIYQGLGRRSDAESALSDLIVRFGARDPFRVAEVYAHRGDREAAFEWLHKAADLKKRGLFAHRAWWYLRLSPLLEPLHSDPRWASWVSMTTKAVQR